MKIAIICDWFHPRIGGIEVHLQGLAESLLASGHEPEIITATPGNSQGYGFPVHRLEVPVTKRFGLIYTFDAFRQVATLLDKGSFDIVHYHYSIWSPLVFGSAYMTKSKHIPTVATCHSMLHYYHILFFLADCLINWSKLPVIFTSVSPSAARVMSKSGRISRIHILPNAVQKSMWLRPGLPRSGDDLTLISVMRFSIRKRAHVLIKMMPEIIRQSGKRCIRLIIVGDGKQRDSLVRLVKSTGLQKTVEFTGMLSQEVPLMREVAIPVSIQVAGGGFIPHRLNFGQQAPGLLIQAGLQLAFTQQGSDLPQGAALAVEHRPQCRALRRADIHPQRPGVPA